MSLSYEKAGVNIDNADAAKEQMAEKMETRDPRVLHKKDAFAALYEITGMGYREPVLVMKTEEPGSKQKLAVQHGRPAGVAYDMIHHLIDDIIVTGARPLLVQDCIVCGKLEKDVVVALVAAVADACKSNDCLLLGGETSEQPGVVDAGVYILSSSIVGMVEKSKIIDGRTIVAGDAVVAVASNGLHTNGYSLVRALMAQQPDLPGHKLAGPDGKEETFIDAILRPHTCYWQAFKGLFEDNVGGALHGIAHITGAGIVGNLERIMPASLDAVIEAPKMRILPLFKLIKQRGNVPEADMLRTFNCGVGMTIVCAASAAEGIIAHVKKHGHDAYLVGRVEKGSGKVRYEGSPVW